MTSATALISRINRAAGAGRGVRFTPDEADRLRAVLELSEAYAQAHALDTDAGLLDDAGDASIPNTETPDDGCEPQHDEATQ